MRPKKFIQCTTALNRDAVRRETINGIEHIIVSSHTMPDDVVMNGVLYPAQEIHRSFEGLNRTLAPIGHPTDGDGNFISATDPLAISNYYAGAYNDRATREGPRIRVDKTINVLEAKNSERGRRLLDAVDRLENDDKAAPIHTSTGIFLELEELDAPIKNNAGQEYTSIAHNLLFDHDAILLDEVGAAQPGDGVGMAVNSEGAEIESEIVNLDLAPSPFLGDLPQAQDAPSPSLGPSYFTLIDQLQEQGAAAVTNEWLHVADLYNGRVIYETNDGYFEGAFIIDTQDKAVLAGIPTRVDRIVSYQPRTNSAKGTNMADPIVNEEAPPVDAPIVEDPPVIDPPVEPSAEITAAVNAAIEPLQSKIDALTESINADTDAERGSLTTVIVNSDKFAGMTEDDLKLLPLERLRAYAASTGSGHGLTPADPSGNDNVIALEMPA